MTTPLILGIETSCDETACALYCRNTRRIAGEWVRSQARQHAAYGGVVPELAARDHLGHLLPAIDRLLAGAQATPAAVAYTQGPGLAASLLAGAATACALAYAWGVPTIAVNHLTGHLLSPLLRYPRLPFPHLCLLVSGGHTQLWQLDAADRHTRLGTTIDDAAGEAFDKTAVLLGLNYPGGARLEQLARHGRADTVALPAPVVGGYDFSFSGLKTAVRRQVEKHAAAPADIAASFQAVVAVGLARQVAAACRATGIAHLTAVGGVARNNAIARALRATAKQYGGQFYRPHPRHCSDNAAMVALAAAYQTPTASRRFTIQPKFSAQ